MASSKLTVPILLEWSDIESYMGQHDIVKVVRCKDCKHWQKELFGSRWCKGIERIDGDWFCADGERNES